MCHIEAVSLAIGSFYFDSAIRERVARCSSPRRVPERSRVASSSARTSRKIRNIVAPGLSQSEPDERARCVHLHVSLVSAVRPGHVVVPYPTLLAFLRTRNAWCAVCDVVIIVIIVIIIITIVIIIVVVAPATAAAAAATAVVAAAAVAVAAVADTDDADAAAVAAVVSLVHPHHESYHHVAGRCRGESQMRD